MDTEMILLPIYFSGVVVSFFILVLIIKPETVVYEKYHILWRTISCFWPVLLLLFMVGFVFFAILEIVMFIVFAINWKWIFLRIIKKRNNPLVPKSATYGLDFFDKP